MVSRVGDLQKTVDEDISGYLALQGGVQQDMAATQDLMAKGKAAQQVLKD